MKHKLTTTLTAAGLFLLPACGGDTEAATVLRITGIPDSKITELEAQGGALSVYLGEELGIEARYAKSNDYKAAVNNLAANKADLVWLGGVTTVQAEDRTDGQIELVVCREIDLHFKSYFIANKDVLESGKVKKVDSLEELKPMLADLSFRFGSQLSTSGHIMPRHFMVQAGIDPEEDCMNVSFSLTNGHTETLQAVASGQVDIGVLNFTHWENASAELKEKAPIVYVTPDYVDYCMVAHRRLGEDTIANIRQAFLDLDYDNPEHQPLLDAFSAKKFVAADPAKWDSIRTVYRDLDARGMLGQ